MLLIANIVDWIFRLLTLLVIAHTILSFFVTPWHPAREFTGRLVEPMLSPIRRILPPVGMLDFSPFVLIILLQVVGTILIRFLINLA